MAITKTFLQSVANDADLTTYTFPSQNLGTASAGRYIVALIAGSSGTSGRTISSVTIGGVSASQLGFVSEAGSTRASSIWIAAVPTGTTGDVVITWSAGMGRCGVGLYSLTGAQTTAFDTATATATSGTTLSDTINIPAGGVCFSVATAQVSGDYSWSWTNITEDFDTLLETGSPNHNRFTGASDVFGSSQSGLALTATASSTIGSGSMLAVSLAAVPAVFSPAMMHHMQISGGLM